MSLFGKIFGKKDAEAEAPKESTEAHAAEQPADAQTAEETTPAAVPTVEEATAAAEETQRPEVSEAGEERHASRPSLVPAPAARTGEASEDFRQEETAEEEPRGGGPVLVASGAASATMPESGAAESGAGEADAPRTLEQMRNDPNFVRVFDQYGQEVFLTKQQWRDEVLPANLQGNWNNADALYAVLLNAMNDGMFAEIEAAAAHLREIDTNLVRGTCVHAIVLQQLGRNDESEAILNTYVAEHGEEGAVLTNLAKIYAARNENERAETTLWRAVELDPNLENGLGWYLAIEFERGGEEARQRAMERIAALPGSWRIRLWLAKLALGANDLPRALQLYREGLANFAGPVPTEFLYPMSGDLGMAGKLRELLEMSEPLFQPELHGVVVGNNLVKAHVDLGELDQAMDLVNSLFAQRRPDWRDTLGFWENTIARMRLASARPAPQGPIEIGMLEMIGPVWKRHGGALSEVFGSKAETAPVVTILGGTAELTQQPNEQQQMQLADALGRLSRALPLFLAEQVEFTTAAQARSLVPRVAQGGSGFVLRGGEWGDAEAMELAREGELEPAFVVKAHVDARGEQWVITATVLRAVDAVQIGVARAEFAPGQPELAAVRFAAELREILVQAGITAESSPAVYQLPEGQLLANYMLRLEQLLAVRAAVTAGNAPVVLSGEREILEGTLWLALQLGGNPTVRALLASMTAALGRVRPEILPEFADRFTMLQRDLPLGEPLDGIISDMLLD